MWLWQEISLTGTSKETLHQILHSPSHVGPMWHLALQQPGAQVGAWGWYLEAHVGVTWCTSTAIRWRLLSHGQYAEAHLLFYQMVGTIALRKTTEIGWGFLRVKLSFHAETQKNPHTSLLHKDKTVQLLSASFRQSLFFLGSSNTGTNKY